MKRVIKKSINTLLLPFGLQINRRPVVPFVADAPPQKGPSVKGWISAEETIRAAKEKGLSVVEYLHSIRQNQDEIQNVIDEMQRVGIFKNELKHCVEIGTGSGMYLEKVVKVCSPEIYESYEPSEEWAAWLEQEYQAYHVTSCFSDGRALKSTASSTVDLVHANGVFVYLSFLTCYRYFQEIVRVTQKDGYAVFDIFSENCFDDATVQKWLQAEEDFPRFLCKEYVIAFFEKHGFSYIHSFYKKLGVGQSEYVIFRKTRS